MLIGNGEVHLDASGFIGCWYLTGVNPTQSRTPWVSSSPALLAELAGEQVGTRDPRQLSYRIGVEWFPPPRARYAAVRRLLLSQVLRLADGTVRERRLFPHTDPTISYENVLEKLETGLVTFLRRMPRAGRSAWLTLTAGYDSRVLLAAVVKSGIQVRTFTQDYRSVPVANEEKFRSISLADRILPSRLSAAAGLEHVWVGQKRFDARRTALFDAHTGHEVVDVQRHFFARRQWDFAQEGDLIVGGLCFEVGRCYFWHKLGDSNVPDGAQIARGWHEAPNSSLMAAMAEWIEWTEHTPHPELDWRDRFYIEQRLGGWQSARELSMDLIPVDLIHPMNSARAHALSLCVPQEKRIKGEHQIDLVRRMAPHLLEFPINPDYDYFHPLTRLYCNWRDDYTYPFKWIARRSASLVSSRHKGL